MIYTYKDTRPGQHLVMVPISIKSIEETSVIRKFTLLFLIASILPLLLLCLFYLESLHNDKLPLFISNLKPALLLTVIGTGFGYWAMRKIVSEFVRATKSNRQAFSKIIGQDLLPTSDEETNELFLLIRTFNEIKSSLEKDIQRLELTKQTLNSVLLKVSKGIASAKTLDHFLQLIIETITEALMGRAGSIFLIDKQEFFVKSSWGENSESLTGVRFKTDSPLFQDVLRSKGGLIISTPESILPSAPSQVSGFLEFPLICCPLTVSDRPVGLILVCGRRIPEDFQEYELSLLNNVAAQATLAINNEELKHLSRIDPLTNIYNYRHLVETLDYEIHRCKRYPEKLYLLLVDIDDFKAYNDALGHLAGDALLQEIPRAMSHQLRISDTICRYEGDEFSIILPQTDLQGAQTVANKIKASLENSVFEKKITACIGIAEWSEEIDRRELMFKAEGALSQAKKEGKNKIVVSQ